MCFGRFFRPSSGAYKTVWAALVIVMLSCCLPLVWTGWNPTTPAVQSALIRHTVQPFTESDIPDAVITQFVLLKMGMLMLETCRGL